jgi:hypothetical protein
MFSLLLSSFFHFHFFFFVVLSLIVIGNNNSGFKKGGGAHKHQSNDANQSPISDLSTLRYLVIDEADKMTERGRFDELTSILGKICMSS